MSDSSDAGNAASAETTRDCRDPWSYVEIMVNGDVKPCCVREAVGIQPGDKVVVRATASGGVYVGRPDKASEYEEKLRALAKRRTIRDGMTTDEFMEFSRGESATFRRRKK